MKTHFILQWLSKQGKTSFLVLLRLLGLIALVAGLSACLAAPPPPPPDTPPPLTSPDEPLIPTPLNESPPPTPPDGLQLPPPISPLPPTAQAQSTPDTAQAGIGFNVSGWT